MIILRMNMYLVFSSSNGIPKPQCVLYFVILFNEAIKLAKLIRHLETKHKHFFNRPIEFFLLEKTKS